MAKYLIVCGGAGRGLLQRFEELGFAAALQVDVAEELVQIPSPNMHSFDLSHGQAGKSMVSVYQSYMDVLREEVIHVAAELERAMLAVESIQDRNEGPVDSVEKKQRQIELNSAQKTIQELSSQHEALLRKEKHALLVRHSMAPRNPVQGLYVSPAFWSGYMQLPQVRDELDKVVARLFNAVQHSDHEFEFYVVASMCGAVGQGVYKAIIDALKRARRLRVSSDFRFRIIRDGATRHYQKYLNAGMRCSFALASDFAYMQLNKTSNDPVSLKFQYIDFRDVGAGSSAKHLHQEQMVDYFRTLMHSEVALQYIQVFNQHQVAMSRHQWKSHGLDQTRLYVELLTSLCSQLYELSLVSPRTEDSQPHQVEKDEIYNRLGVVLDNDLLHSVLESTVSVPPRLVIIFKHRFINRYMPSITVDAFEQSTLWISVSRYVRAFLGEAKVNELRATSSVHVYFDQSKFEFLRSLSSAVPPLYSVEYIQTARMAKQYMNDIHALLITSKHALQYELHSFWNQLHLLSQYMQKFLNENVAMNNVTRTNHKIVQLYLEISVLIETYHVAVRFLQLVNTDSRMIEEIAHSVLLGLPLETRPPILLVHSLEAVIESKTWLQHLAESLQGNPRVALEKKIFHRALMKGIRGVTYFWLTAVLGLPADTRCMRVTETVNTIDQSDSSLWFGVEFPHDDHRNGNCVAFAHFPSMEERDVDALRRENKPISLSTNLVSVDYSFNMNHPSWLGVGSGQIYFARDEQMYTVLTRSLRLDFDESLRQQWIHDDELGIAMTHNGEPVYLPAHIADSDLVLKPLERLFCETLKDYVTVVRGE